MDESFTKRSIKYKTYSEYIFHVNFSYFAITRKNILKNTQSEKTLNINANKTSSVYIKSFQSKTTVSIFYSIYYSNYFQ